MILAAQILLILAVTSACGWLARRVGQPPVVGEIAGGILIGPLGLIGFFPTLGSYLFASTSSLQTISEIGLVLFLLHIGAELDLTELRRTRHETAAITAGSICLPFALGLAISIPLWSVFSGHSRWGFSLFIAIASSITALPVLARILRDRVTEGRALPAGVAAQSLLSAATNDFLGWILLALTLAALHGAHGLRATSAYLLSLAAYLVGMWVVARPLLKRIASISLWLAVPLCIAFGFASAHLTDRLGVHAFFGAFLAGLCLPRTSTALLPTIDKVTKPIISVTLPLFFALTGLRMQRNMFTGTGWTWLLLILAVAVIGKIAGASSAARLCRMPWSDALRIGILLNTRGLVELIVLNVGYREGLLSPALFTLFVLMAVITTAMTVPLLMLLERSTSR